MNDKNILLDKLNEVLEAQDLEKAKKLTTTLKKINILKHSIEDNLLDSIIYKKIADVLNEEFNIDTFKIVYIAKGKETVLYKTGDDKEYTHFLNNIVSNNRSIDICLVSGDLTEEKELIINAYFQEFVHLIYMQYILLFVQKSSTIDPLTKLQNRISFNTEMKTLVPLAIRENMKFGVLLVNIDRFRAVNDEHGDEFGDEFLKLYANTITECVRSSDITVRFSGGEFLILLINVDSEEMTMKIAEKIKDKLASVHLMSPNNDKFQKTVSVGVSMFPEDSSDINEVVKFSEMALCDARDIGRGQLIRFKKHDDGEIDLF